MNLKVMAHLKFAYDNINSLITFIGTIGDSRPNTSLMNHTVQGQGEHNCNNCDHCENGMINNVLTHIKNMNMFVKKLTIKQKATTKNICTIDQ